MKQGTGFRACDTGHEAQARLAFRASGNLQDVARAAPAGVAGCSAAAAQRCRCLCRRRLLVRRAASAVGQPKRAGDQPAPLAHHSRPAAGPARSKGLGM